MAKTLILGNNPQKWWVKDIADSRCVSVPDISVAKSIAITDFILTLPHDIDCIVIDADSISTANNELVLDITLYIRLMLHECQKTALSCILIVSDFSFEAYKGYGAKSMVLMTQGISLVNSESVIDAVKNARPLTPGEYVEGFLNLIKIEPQEKIEGRHSIANEWGAEALFNVIAGGVKSSIIPVKTSSSLYFKYSNVAAIDANDVTKIIEGRVSQYLTKKVIIPDKFNYLLIDDEAGKGWDKVLNSLLPNAKQDLWNHPINSYEELSEEIKHKISKEYYDIIFLDLRMAGVTEENILKPEDFSGMKILKAIKKINKGIQVIMLTATNKAWNLQALIDAGANGYYMKESPEYHFPLKYSEQNALTFVNTINSCLDNSCLQYIVAQQNSLCLPTDSELSDNVTSQLSIAISLILKAKTASEYALAYISLEQIFEIASKYLIRQESKGNTIAYYFTEDTRERCCLYKAGIRQGLLESSKGGVPLALWKKISAIYYQLYDGTDKELGENVKRLINLRNEYIHPNNGIKPNITRDDFINLYETVLNFLSVFK